MLKARKKAKKEKKKAKKEKKKVRVVWQVVHIWTTFMTSRPSLHHDLIPGEEEAEEGAQAAQGGEPGGRLEPEQQAARCGRKGTVPDMGYR